MVRFKNKTRFFFLPLFLRTIYIYLWCDKFPREQADGRQGTVSQERNGCPGIYNRVDIRKPFQKF
jgi:hypothetical protein